MNKLTFAFAAITLGSSLAMADCPKPEMPTMPDGASAKMEDMLQGQKAVKTFQTANVDYMKCLEELFNSAEAKIKSGKLTGDDLESTQKIYSEAVDAYNAAVSSEETMAGRFNAAIRAYKAANPS
ncbi:MAG: hypothetical protein ACK5HY_04690 [Parahaliea sp.]